MEHIDISKRLKELISLYDMNVKEFAEFVGISRTSLTGYLNQKVTPTIDPLVQICRKCNVSLDWLCTNSGQKHFLTVADIIVALKELYNIDNLTPSIELEKKPIYPDGAYNYSCTISFNSNFFDIQPAEDNHCASHLCKFIYDWKTTMDQLKHLTDNEIIENYKQMWWDKQIAYYSNIPVKIKKDAEDKTSEEAEIRLPLIGKVDFEL